VAALDALPTELFLEILDLLEFTDLKSLRWVCKSIREGPTAILVDTIQFSLTPKSWQRLEDPSRSDRVCHHVQTTYFIPKISPKFRDKEAWLHYIDIRPFAEEYYAARSHEKGERLNMRNVHRPFKLAYKQLQIKPFDEDAAYDEYQKLVAAQARLISAYDVKLVVQRFSQLIELKTLPWYDSWYERPVAGADDAICPYE
jgi:hypothetical protein